MTNTIPPNFPPLQTPYYVEDEIDIVDLWLVLVRRKWIFFFVFLSIVLAGAVVTLVIPSTYQSRTVLQVGPDVGKIESAAVLVQRLTEEYRIGDLSEGQGKYPLVERISLNKGQADILTITALGHSPEEARNFLASVIDRIFKEQEKLLDQALKEQTTKLEMLRQRSSTTRQQIATMANGLNNVKIINPAQAALMLQEKSKLMEELAFMDQEQSFVGVVIERMRIAQTRLLRPPTLPIAPIQPRPVLYLSLATVMGLALGFIAVFFVEFFSKARRRLAQKVQQTPKHPDPKGTVQ